MRRSLPLGVALLAALALALAPAAQARHRPGVFVRCDRADATAVFEGRMDAIPGAVRMQMRFKLEISTPDEPRWSRVRVPGFSAWVTSDPGRSRYVYTKRLEELLAPADYRVRMHFRWLDGTGAVVRRAHSTSRGCRQPDPRPDLEVDGLVTERDGRRYVVTVRNRGRGRAEPSSLRLALADGTVLTAPVGALERRESEDVVLTGPACAPGESLTLTADARDTVDEADEDDTVTLPCPAPSA